MQGLKEKEILVLSAIIDVMSKIIVGQNGTKIEREVFLVRSRGFRSQE